MFKLFIIAVLGSFVVNAYSMPLTSSFGVTESLYDEGGENGSPIPNQPEEFEGIIALNNCSGAVVKLDGMADSHKAWILTNGHCVQKSMFGGMMSPGEVIKNVAQERSVRVFNKSMGQVNVKTTKLIYGTMTKTDMAIYELNISYAELYNKSLIRPFTLAANSPKAGTSFKILSGYWKQTWQCAIDGEVFRLLEGGYEWKDSFRYSYGCRTPHGSSGSPVIELGTRQVIAVNNTGNDKNEMCTINNPCEIDENGQKTVIHQRGYAQHTDWLYTCLNTKNVKNYELDLNKQGCLLVK